jgi:predicted nucleic acid-binding protein
LTAFIDTNVFVRHLTGDPVEQAAAATRYLAAADELILEDLIVAEVAYVLQSVYKTPRADIALSLRAILGFPAVRVADPELLQRTVEIYDINGLDFAEAYLIASAERSGIGTVASFDRQIDGVGTVRRDEPA